MADPRDAAKPELSKRLLAAGKAYGQWRLAGHQSDDDAAWSAMGDSYTVAAALMGLLRAFFPALGYDDV
jgi:hypothetical protein